MRINEILLSNKNSTEGNRPDPQLDLPPSRFIDDPTNLANAFTRRGRPEEPILRQFGELQPHWIRAESPENLGDLRIYVREWLAGLDLPQSEAPALIDRMLAASQGNFLYLRMLMKQ